MTPSRARLQSDGIGSPACNQRVARRYNLAEHTTASSVKLLLRVPVSKQFHPDFLLTREFTAGGHKIGFTTGQQKHVTLSLTPYLGVYVREH